jgi:predicted nucleotidyltransferase
MKKDLDHLPPRKRRELARIVEILHEEFEEAQAGATSEKRRRGRILKIVLFGSYARGDWVDARSSHRGYQSDYDILIVVNQHKLTDEAAIWYKAEDRVMRLTKAPFTLIVHTLDEVNDELAKGHYFFADIWREGIELYSLKGSKPLLKPRPLNAQQAYDAAKEHFEQRFPHAIEFLPVYQFCRERPNLKLAAFNLHQAVEHAYHAQHRQPAWPSRGSRPAAGRGLATSLQTGPLGLQHPEASLRRGALLPPLRHHHRTTRLAGSGHKAPPCPDRPGLPGAPGKT